MRIDFKNSLILFIGGLLAVFVFIGVVLAQEVDKDQALQLLQQIGGPGGCSSEESCRSFCDDPTNFDTCINWAQEHGLMSGDEAERARKFAEQGRNFSGPGGCQSPEECESFCNQPQNHEVCLDFAVGQGFLTSDEAERIKEFRREAERFREEGERIKERIEVDPEFDKERALQIIETQGGPGGCRTMDQCEEFCEEPQNQETCFAFAERHGLFKNREAVEKIRKIISDGGPGGCKGKDQCHEFCEDPANFEVCIEFAEEHEFIKPEEVERAKRGARALKEGGPGGCHSPRECESFCSNPTNQEVCFEWAKGHGFVSEEQIRMMEEFKQRREQIEREFERKGEEFRPPEGFHPPGDGETFPAGQCFIDPCANWPSGEDCPIKAPVVPVACNDPNCNSGPCLGSGTVSPPPEAEHIRACFEKGGVWTGSTCEFPKGEFTPPPEYSPLPKYTPIYSPTPEVHENPATRCAKEGGTWNSEINTCVFEKGGSILQNTGVYILNAFKEFFR